MTKISTLMSRRGYTLPELMVGIALFGILSAGVSAFFLHNLATSYMAAGKLRVSGDIRRFTSELTVEARNASYFELFESYSATETPLRDNRSGDMIVLFYLDHEGELERCVGYFRAANPGEEGPVRKFDSAEDGFDPSTLPPVGQEDHFPIVIELSRGLADGRLFFNFYDRSILVRGEIVHPGNLRREATNTYNFTVSPRS